MRESLAGPQASVLECRIQVKDGASARRLGEVLTRAPPILLERQAPDFSSCRYLDRVRVRDDPSPKAMPTAYPFGEATKIRGPASGPQPVRLLVYDEDEDEDVDVDEAEGALHLVRTREVATQFCGNDASIQTALYVPTTMGAAHPAFKAMTDATDAAMNSLDPASFLEQPPPPPPTPYMYGYPPQPYMMMPPPQVSPTVMKEARADFDRMLRDQQKLHDMLASVRKDLEKAHADVMNAVPQTAMPPAASVIKEPRPPDLPYWKAYMDVDPSLSERRRASSPSTTSRAKRRWAQARRRRGAEARGDMEMVASAPIAYRGLVDVRAAQCDGMADRVDARRARRHVSYINPAFAAWSLLSKWLICRSALSRRQSPRCRFQSAFWQSWVEMGFVSMRRGDGDRHHRRRCEDSGDAATYGRAVHDGPAPRAGLEGHAVRRSSAVAALAAAARGGVAKIIWAPWRRRPRDGHHAGEVSVKKPHKGVEGPRPHPPLMQVVRGRWARRKPMTHAEGLRRVEEVLPRALRERLGARELRLGDPRTRGATSASRFGPPWKEAQVAPRRPDAQAQVECIGDRPAARCARCTAGRTGEASCGFWGPSP